MQLKSNRKFDSNQEKIINQFTYTFFLKKEYKDVEMVYDVDKQICGIDAICDGLNIDIKAQASYINNPRPTFILELSFLDKYGNLKKGWFLNDKLSTTHYCFIWIPSAKSNILKSIDDINRLEIMVVDKERLKDYIFNKYGERNIYKTLDEMITNGVRYTFLDGGVKYCQTTTLFEKPVTLVVPKYILKKFSTKHCIVTKEKIINIVDNNNNM